MHSQRLTRINELLKREIAAALFREIPAFEADLARVMVTRVEISSNLRNAHVSVSVRGDETQAAAVLRALNRHRAAIQRTISRDVILKYTPVLHFTRDESVAAGDHILAVLHDLEAHGELPPEPDSPAPPAAPAPETDDE